MKNRSWILMLTTISITIIAYFHWDFLTYLTMSGQEAVEMENKKNHERYMDAIHYLKSLKGGHNFENLFKNNKIKRSNFENLFKNNKTKRTNFENRFKNNKTSPSRYDVVITVLTSYRDKPWLNIKPHYLTQVVSKLVKLFLAKENHFRYDMHMAVCNVDTSYRNENEVDFVSDFVEVFSRTRSPLKISNYNQAKSDYVFCLGYTLDKWNPRYVMILEDDALPKDNLLDVVEYTVKTHLDNELRQGELYPKLENKIGYVKFYHPNRLLTYTKLGIERIPELVGISILVATFTTFIYLKLVNKKKQWNLSQVKKMWKFCFVYFCTLALFIGRTNINKWRYLFVPYSLSFTPAPSCCTQANLYSNKFAKILVHNLNFVTCNYFYGYDTAIEDLLSVDRYKAILVQPNSIEHIGLHSTLHWTTGLHPYNLD